jgi:hypothetical protein
MKSPAGKVRALQHNWNAENSDDNFFADSEAMRAIAMTPDAKIGLQMPPQPPQTLLM